MPSALLAEAQALAPDLTELGLLLASLEPAAPAAEDGTTDDGDATVEAPDGEPDGDGPLDDGPVDDGSVDDDYVYQIALGLPEKWFDGVDDPIRDHPVLNRYLPDARDRLAAAGVELAPVRVYTLDDDDPATYQILLDDEWVASGTVAEDRWFVPAAFMTSLPGPLAAAAEPMPDAPGLFTVPIAPDADAATLLVVCPAEEVVVRTLESIVSERALGAPEAPEESDQD